MDKRTVREAKRLARQRHTSVSAMFCRFVEELEREDEWIKTLSPNTRKALGLAAAMPDRPYRELMEEALAEKHGMP